MNASRQLALAGGTILCWVGSAAQNSATSSAAGSATPARLRSLA